MCVSDIRSRLRRDWEVTLAHVQIFLAKERCFGGTWSHNFGRSFAWTSFFECRLRRQFFFSLDFTLYLWVWLMNEREWKKKWHKRAQLLNKWKRKITPGKRKTIKIGSLCRRNSSAISAPLADVFFFMFKDKICKELNLKRKKLVFIEFSFYIKTNFWSLYVFQILILVPTLKEFWFKSLYWYSIKELIFVIGKLLDSVNFYLYN